MLRSGELNLLVGGAAAALECCRPAFASFARAIYHVGGSGAGRAIKLVNNILWAAHNQLTVDALQFAEALGLEPRATARVILECSGASDSQYVFVQPNWRETFEFMRPYMTKDVSAAAEAARDANVDLGTLGAVVNAYNRLALRGFE
jgi:3-hydroxyisobutyrate dehydrogenase